MDVSTWLRDLGLEIYAQAFHANHIDTEVLPRLTAEDLTAIGVVSVGHRRRLLDAIAALDQGRAPAAEPTAGTVRPVEAERRQLTVLFCDLVGSTELAARLDPEDLGQVIRAYHGACTETVERWGGHVAKYMGDGVLAYFGWPVAHEDEAERAVRAGLVLTQAIGRLATPAREPLAARVGIATGLVVVGELIGEGLAKEQTVVGETPNLAARLQAIAAPGSVVISQATRRLVGGLFELVDLGPRRLKGFAAPLAAFRVEGEGLGDAPYTPLSHYCSPYHTNSALYPIITQLERAAGIAPDDEPAAKLTKLELVLGQATERLDEAVPLLAALLGLPVGERYPPLKLRPEWRKQRTLEVLIEQLAGLTRDRPVVELYEDVHWIDPSTLELLDLLVERVCALPVLVALTYRPEFSPSWAGHAHVTTLPLNRLGRRQGAAMVGCVTGGKALPPEVVEQIVTRTDGVPLFVEELTKTVLESGLLTDKGDHYELSGPLPPLAIPTTLHDSLMARLDRLAPVKEIAQTGAVIGRQFSHELLAAVAPISANQLGDALEQLVSSELVFRRGAPPAATYTFKHALIQDAAYQSLLKSRRQQLHARIAEALEQRFPDIGQTQPEVLAQHLTEAGLAARAIPYWRRGGELAAGRSANVEAIAHLSRGLNLIGALPNAAEHVNEELALRLAIGGPLIATQGHAAPEVERTYSRAWVLCEQLGRSAELFPVLRGLWNYHMVRGELRRADDLSARLVALAEEQRTPVRRALARRARGTTLVLLGRFADAEAALKEGITIDDAVVDWEDPAHLLLYTERAGVVCRLHSAWTFWFLGFPDRASESIEAGLALGRRLAHVPSLAFALIWAALLHNLRREFAEARARAEAAIQIASEYRLPQWLAFATICRGFALVGIGQRTEGIAQLQTGLADWNGTGARVLDTQWLGFTAEACAQAGRFDDALAALDRATATVAATGEGYYQAELQRLRGGLLGEAGDAAEAASWLQQAIDTACSQQAKSLELRAATSLARLWRDRGRGAQAHSLLAPVYGWFTEGFDTADLKDAKALLDELA